MTQHPNDDDDSNNDPNDDDDDDERGQERKKRIHQNICEFHASMKKKKHKHIPTIQMES